MKYLLSLIIIFFAISVGAEPFLTCDPPLSTNPPVEFHTVTGAWINQAGTIAVPSASDGSCHFDLGPIPIGINNMTISSCSTADGCSDPRAFIVYRTHGYGLTLDQKTYTVKDQWTVREGDVILYE